MDIEELAVGDLHPYKKNAKKHPAEQVARIAASLSEFGFQQPIVIDNDNVVIIGHGRLQAAQMLGMATVPCLRADSLSPAQIRALRLADNKTAESEWDLDLLQDDMSDLDFDMGQFGFDISAPAGDTEDEDDDEDEEEIDPRSPSCQHNVFENQERMQFVETNYYGIPQMRVTQTTGNKMYRFCDWRELEDPSDFIAHFYYDDFKFISAWREPDKYIDRLRRFKAVVSPNFSLYMDFPRCLQILSCYRRNWVSAYWQTQGLDVIPCVMWGDRESWNYCFEGLPVGGTVSVSTVTAVKYLKQDDPWFIEGYEEMIRRLKPKTILLYGDMIDGLPGNIIRCPSFYEERRKIIGGARNGTKKFEK